MANEAFACEQKEEKLVSDAVKHLTDANLKLSTMNNEYQLKVEESLRQKEEITHLLAKVRLLHINFGILRDLFLMNNSHSLQRIA